MVRQGRKSRLLPSIQNKLLEQFVAGVSARTAADLTGVNRNTAILFFHKLREIIVEKMAAEAPFLAGGLNLMSAISEAFERASEVEGLPVRYRSLVYSSVEAGSMR